MSIKTIISKRFLFEKKIFCFVLKNSRLISNFKSFASIINNVKMILKSFGAP